jgi:hypothetical protein
MERVMMSIKIFKSSKNKRTILTAAVLVLLLCLSGAMLTILPVSAQPASTQIFPSNAYASVSPNPAGINQQVSVLMWLTEFAPTASGVQGGRWTNFTLLITAPDGTTQTLGPFTADDASVAYTQFIPTQIGTYTIKFTFPGQLEQGVSGFFGLVPIDAYYEASSFTTTLTVQEQPATVSPQTPLPSDYWSRPITAENQQWYTIAGNWLAVSTVYTMSTSVAGAGNMYSQGPNSAHIVWTKPLVYGGLIGGPAGGTTISNYYTGKTYESMFTPPIILNGVLYYNSPSEPREGFYAVDLRTGQDLWWQNSTGSLYITGTTQGFWRYPGVSAGQVYSFQTPDEEGGRPYLWWTGNDPWCMYDAETGELILTITNVTSGTMVVGPQGELLSYILSGSGGWIAMWNSSKCIGTLADQFPPEMFNTYTGDWCWRVPVGQTLDWNRGVQWNVTIPAGIPTQAITAVDYDDGVILAMTASMLNSQPMMSQMEIGYSTTTGERLWAVNRTFSPPIIPYSLMMSAVGGGIYAEFNSNTMQWYGYDIKTGNQLWGPTDAYTNAWGSQPQPALIADGTLYGLSIDGLHAFNAATGQKLWDFYADNSGADVPGFSTYPFLGWTAGPIIADGKIYVVSGTSHGDPVYPGMELYCVNATSGDKLWDIPFFGSGSLAIADGYVVGFNGYDNQIYCFGKGNTATTVSAPDTAIPQGEPVLIQGTVTDQSPGTTATGVLSAGTPAISDESMSAWMAYLYEQKPKPTDATGVEVHLTAIDPNGNSQDIGTAISNSLGNYATKWTPPVSGLYTITATFEGSNSYYGSQAGTSFVVSEAATPAPATTPISTATPPAIQTPTPAQIVSPSPSEAPQPSTSETPSTTYIAIAAAVIVIVTVAAVLLLRKRK